ncbi:MAG: phosphoribosyl-AMP cyclohydrolase [Pseudomonadota bacterium]
MDWLDEINWNEQGLIAVIAQDENKMVLMQAWMNKEALLKTRETGKAVYWSRSKQRLWMKGESSGHVQWVQSIRLDCDSDSLLLVVKQEGGIACHTGRANCFYKELVEDEWQTKEAIIKDPEKIYGQ